MGHAVGQSHNNSDIISDIFCIPKVPMSKRHLTSELQCVDRTWKLTDAERKVQLGIKKNALRKYEKTPREPMRFRRMPTISSVSTADSGGAWIWDLGRTSESERFCFKKEPFRSAWSLLLKSKCRHVTYSHGFSCVAITAMVISWQYWHWQLRIFQSRTHSSILTLARALSWRALLSIQWISTYRGTLCFPWFLGVSRKMVVDCGCSTAYRDLKAVILVVFGSLAGPVGQELQQGANLQATPEDGHFFNCSLVKRRKRMTPNRIPSHQHWTSFCQFSVPKVCTFTSHMSSYVIHWAHRWRMRTDFAKGSLHDYTYFESQVSRVN